MKYKQMLIPILLFSLIFTGCETFSIFNPGSQYHAVDFDVDKTLLQSTEDLVILQVDWIPKDLASGYKGYAFVDIFKDGELYEQEAYKIQENRKEKHTYMLNGFSDGWNKVKVVVGLSKLDEGGKGTITKNCPETQYYYPTWATNIMDWLMEHSSCRLLKDKHGVSDYSVNDGISKTWFDEKEMLEKDVGYGVVSEIPGLYVNSKSFDIYKEFDKEIIDIDEPLCRYKFLICWDFLFK